MCSVFSGAIFKRDLILPHSPRFCIQSLIFFASLFILFSPNSHEVGQVEGGCWADPFQKVVCFGARASAIVRFYNLLFLIISEIQRARSSRKVRVSRIQSAPREMKVRMLSRLPAARNCDDFNRLHNWIALSHKAHISYVTRQKFRLRFDWVARREA